jgi:hypothetical protein
MWFSEAGQVDTFDPLNVVVPCSSDARIVGLAVLDVGLMVMTTTASGRDGLILLRGTSGNFRIEVLRSGLSAAERTTEAHKTFATVWSETGSAVFVDRQGGVWQTNGLEIGRLDGPTLSPYGPATDDDHCAAVGRWLFVSRGKRLLVLRSFGESGAWTELVTPSMVTFPTSEASPAVVSNVPPADQVKSMTELGQSLWFLSGGRPFRFAVGATSATRGTFDHGEPLPGDVVLPGFPISRSHRVAGLELGTATMAVPQQGDLSHRKSLWHRTGVRARGRDGAQLLSVETFAGPVLSGGAGHSVSVDGQVTDRFELVVPAGIGYANEASALLRFAGDVEVESVTLWASGGEPSR